MMKTILAIVQQYKREQNLPFPTSLVGATTPDELQMMNLVYEVCEELRAARCWRQCIRTHTFDTETNRSKYLLPADFYSPALRTYWNQDTDQRLIGPVPDNYFNWLLYGGGSSSINYTFRIVGWDANRSSGGGQFQISDTTVTSGVTLSFEYITRHLFLPVDYALTTAYAENALVNVSGNIYKCSSAITESDTVPTGTGTAIADDDGTWDWYNTPIEVAAADTDLCLFDYDLVKLGLKAKDRDAKGGDAEKAEMKFQDRINTAVARYKGRYLGSFSRKSSYPDLRIPYKSWDI